MNFSHKKRPTTFSYKVVGNKLEPIVDVTNNLGGDEKYLYLSPFTGWTLEVEKKDRIDWSATKQIKFDFRARFIPSDRANITAEFVEALLNKSAFV